MNLEQVEKLNFKRKTLLEYSGTFHLSESYSMKLSTNTFLDLTVRAVGKKKELESSKLRNEIGKFVPKLESTAEIGK